MVWEHILFLTALGIASVREPQIGYTLHHTGGRVSKEFTARFQSAIDPDMVLRRHKEVGRLGRMMRSLFGDVVASCLVWIVPIAREDFTEDWVQRFLNTANRESVQSAPPLLR